MKFANKDHVIENSIGLIEGDKIIITEGPLMGHESMIKKIDSHKRIAQLDIEMFGQLRTITVALEIISKQ
jgi:transcription termination/antitermination protein NusG